MARSIARSRLAGAGLLAVAMSVAAQGAAQSALPGLSALPAVPYWWRPPRASDFEALPLAWYNDVDGLVVGGAGQWRFSTATVWSGLGIGLKGGAGLPAGFEAAVLVGSGRVSFRTLSGRYLASLQFLDVWQWSGAQFFVGVSGSELFDASYLETVPFFRCPANAPSAPCTPVPTPYGWSEGRDLAVELGVAYGGDKPDAVRVDGVVIGGVEVLAAGDHGYAGLEAGVGKSGALGRAHWSARLAGGLISSRAPGQRRYRLDGAGSIIRWLNPYLEARGAPLTEVPYFVPGGGHLRAYEDTKPLVKRYLGLSGAVSREGALSRGFWGGIAAFAEGAWTPGLPSPVGPADLNPESDLLFDWEQLPAGEGAGLGQFRASVLDVPAIWADAGVAFTGGFERIAVTVSLPVWASAPDFAGESILNDEKRAFTLRWTLTISFLAPGSFPKANRGE